MRYGVGSNWTHVAVTYGYTPSRHRVYANGVPVFQQNIGNRNEIAAGGSFVIGQGTSSPLGMEVGWWSRSNRTGK